jgi:hypothetical protein
MVDNSTIGSAATWLTDAHGVTKHFDFSISGLTLDAGQTLTLVWFSDYSPSGNKNINFGIDNFKLGDNNTVWTVPLSPSLGLYGSLGVVSWDYLVSGGKSVKV